jgi:hypothetical protein
MTGFQPARFVQSRPLPINVTMPKTTPVELLALEI